MVKTKIQKLKNNTLIVTIPKVFAEIINADKGNYLDWNYIEGKIIIEVVRK